MSILPHAPRTAIPTTRSSSSEKGRGLYVVNGETFEAGAGEILVIKAGEIHSFRCIGETPLIQVDVHLSPRFIQEDLREGGDDPVLEER